MARPHAALGSSEAGMRRDLALPFCKALKFE